jgi:hypothetical protein
MRAYSVRIPIAAALGFALLVGCGAKVETVNEVAAFPSQEIPLDPAAAAWSGVPVYTASLRPQDLVEPRLMESSTKQVRVRALTNGADIGFRLEWDDAAKNDRPGPAKFLDGCGIQIPRQIQPEPPNAQMGEAGAPVDIVFWRADWQASVEGRGDSIRDLYPNASIDHYPFEAASLEEGSAAKAEMSRRYAPAAAVGNRRVGPRDSAVEALAAEGPGTLAPNPDMAAEGAGMQTQTGWAVVIRRPLPQGLSADNRGQIAFAVWEGSHGEVGSRKMITGWTPLAIREER